MKKRLILPLQAKGNLGKTTEISTRACWLNKREVPWVGYDLDPEQGRFSKIFPKTIKIHQSATNTDDLIGIFKTALLNELTIVDPQAHIDHLIVQAILETNFLDLADENNLKITLLLFPADDLEIMANIDEHIDTFKNRTDYIIVKNPARFLKTKMWDSSQLETELYECGAKTLTLHPLSEFAKREIAKAETKRNRPLSWVDAIEEESLNIDPIAVAILHNWLRSMFVQYDALTPLLVPDSIEIKLPTPATPDIIPHRTNLGSKLNFT